MNILIVGNILKDVYLNLDTRTEKFETDKNGTKWLDFSFDASEHYFYNRHSSIGGAAVTLEVLQKLGLDASISDSKLSFKDDSPTHDLNATHRYILVADEKVTYLAPSSFTKTSFTPPEEAVDYLYLDRSAEISTKTAKTIKTYLELSTKTKLVLYVRNFENSELNSLLPLADLIFLEKSPENDHYIDSLFGEIDRAKIITISDSSLTFGDISEPIFTKRIDMLTHLSLHSITSATILGSFVLGRSVEEGLKLARANVENSRLDAVLSLAELENLQNSPSKESELELIARSLVLKPKGILAADESGGSIHKKFEQLNIPDTYENRRDYRNIFFTTPNLEKYVNGVILFDETARQFADNGQNFVDFLIGRRIIPGIKVDQGLEKFPDSLETWTKGLNGLDDRLAEYYQMGLRFAKWRSVFEIRHENDQIVTPSDEAIAKNCEDLAEYAKKCQSVCIVPIVEPEVVYDGNYSIDDCAKTTARILDKLFESLKNSGVNLRACILKCNMVLAGKQFEMASTPSEVGKETAEVLKNHVPPELAGVVFLSGGQTVEQATDNLTAILEEGPFPWPVTFSFARALQDPALYAWRGDNSNKEEAQTAFKDRLIANVDALKPE
ncbi:fructose-bisphosphate aldolase class I [Candidatus Saccharibacteria bacterium]|nr:fructose-bisphosphate aldolase class I [Candidatus Saccharibacteria bacterium]